MDKGSLEMSMKSKMKTIPNSSFEESGLVVKDSKVHGVVDEGSLDTP